MPTLARLQHEFIAAVLEKDPAAVAKIAPDMLAVIADDGLPPDAHLRVYRNNTRRGLTTTLRHMFPAVERQAGDANFRVAARDYIAAYPPRSGNMNQVGADFAAFLAQYEPAAATMPALADIARIEWAQRQALDAESVPPLDVQALLRVTPEAYDRLLFRLHPSCTLLHVHDRAFALWRAHHAPEATDDPAFSDDRLLLIWRGLRGIEVAALTAGEDAFLRALAAGKTLEYAAAAAETAPAGFDLASGLLTQVQRQVLAAFEFRSQKTENRKQKSGSVRH